MRTSPLVASLVLATSSFAAWTPVPTPVPATVSQILTTPSAVVAIADGKPWRSRDKGATWEQASSGLPASAFLIRAVSSGDTVVAYGGATVWRSCDGGASWVNWGEGFVQHGQAGGYFDLDQGDTSFVLALDSAFSTIIWKRGVHAPWTRISGSEQLDTRTTWTGRSFVAGYQGMVVLTLGPSDTAWSLDSTAPLLSGSVSFQGKRWGLAGQGRLLLRTDDAGAHWDTVYRGNKWMSTLSALAGALVGTGTDTMQILRPGSPMTVQLVAQPESYGTGVVELDGRWIFLGEKATWTSSDSGRHWAHAELPIQGMVGTVVRTAQGYAMHGARDASQAWISSDLSSWTSLALPPAVLTYGIDTAGGSLFAFPFGQIWSRNGSGLWSRDSFGIEGTPRPASLVEWDGSSFWTIGGTTLYSRGPTSSLWTKRDSSVSLASDVLAYWKGSLWASAIVGDVVGLASRSAAGTWTYHTLICERIQSLAPTASALWITTESGLFRTTDGQRFDSVIPDPSIPRGQVGAMAAHGDTVAVYLADSRWYAATQKHVLAISVDGGRTWSLDRENIAVSLGFGPRGLVAGLLGGGLSEWTSQGNSVPQRSQLRPAFAWRPGMLEWTSNDARILEILDTRGRILSRTELPEGMRGLAIPSSSAMRIARLHTGHGTFTVTVPALR